MIPGFRLPFRDQTAASLRNLDVWISIRKPLYPKIVRPSEHSELNHRGTRGVVATERPAETEDSWTWQQNDVPQTATNRLSALVCKGTTPEASSSEYSSSERDQ